MSRRWQLGEGITVQDLVRRATTSVGVRQDLQRHYSKRRGIGHPIVKRTTTIQLDANRKAISAAETVEDTVSLPYTIDANQVNTAKRRVQTNRTNGRITTIVITNR